MIPTLSTVPAGNHLSRPPPHLLGQLAVPPPSPAGEAASSPAVSNPAPTGLTQGTPAPPPIRHGDCAAWRPRLLQCLSGHSGPGRVGPRGNESRAGPSLRRRPAKGHSGVWSAKRDDRLTKAAPRGAAIFPPPTSFAYAAMEGWGQMGSEGEGSWPCIVNQSIKLSHLLPVQRYPPAVFFHLARTPSPSMASTWLGR